MQRDPYCLEKPPRQIRGLIGLLLLERLERLESHRTFQTPRVRLWMQRSLHPARSRWGRWWGFLWLRAIAAGFPAAGSSVPLQLLGGQERRTVAVLPESASLIPGSQFWVSIAQFLKCAPSGQPCSVRGILGGPVLTCSPWNTSFPTLIPCLLPQTKEVLFSPLAPNWDSAFYWGYGWRPFTPLFPKAKSIFHRI